MNYVTMSQFGHYGRFGNQVFEVAFLETYAAMHGCRLQLNPWVGNVLFNHKTEPVSGTLEPKVEPMALNGQGLPPTADEYVNHDFRGYAQYHTSWYRPKKDFVKLLFQPTLQVQKRLLPALVKLRKMGKTVVGVHLRRGDYGRSIFYVTPVHWYLIWLAEHWDAFEDPVLFFASETPSLKGEFAKYNPVSAEDLGVNLSSEPLANYSYLAPDVRSREPLQMDFFPDWYLLSQCDVIAAGNSTFPFTAAMMGQVRRYFRSDLPSQSFVEIDPWDAYPLTYDLAEDYAAILGVCLKETKYWRRRPDGTFEEKG